MSMHSVHTDTHDIRDTNKCKAEAKFQKYPKNDDNDFKRIFLTHTHTRDTAEHTKQHTQFAMSDRFTAYCTLDGILA